MNDKGNRGSDATLRSSTLRRVEAKWIALAAVTILMVAGFLAHIYLDPTVPPWCETHTKSWAKTAWPRMFEALGRSWASIWLLCLFVWATGRRRALITALIALLLAGAVAGSLKYIVRRPRPAYAGVPDTSQLRLSAKTSFPSGETTVAFAMATATCAFVTVPWQVILLTTAAGVGTLRVLAFKHFPSDICAGAALGILCGLIGIHIGRRFAKRLPAGWWRRAGWGFWIMLVLPLLDQFTEKELLATFLAGFGPIVVCILVALKGESWLRWVRGRGFGGARQAISHSASGPSRVRKALNAIFLRFADSSAARIRAAVIVLIALAALVILPNLKWIRLNNGLKIELSAHLVPLLMGLLAMWLMVRLAWRVFSTAAALPSSPLPQRPSSGSEKRG